jgi:hypothetical protein
VFFCHPRFGYVTSRTINVRLNGRFLERVTPMMSPRVNDTFSRTPGTARFRRGPYPVARMRVSPQRAAESPHRASFVNTYARKTSDRACANWCVLYPGYLNTPTRGRFTGATHEGRANVVAEKPAERMDTPK